MFVWKPFAEKINIFYDFNELKLIESDIRLFRGKSSEKMW